MCGTNEELTVDHIVPLSKGGTDLLHNLQTMCKTCNMKKGNSHQTLWQRLFGFVTHLELDIFKRDFLNIVKVKQKETEEAVQSKVDSRLGQIEPKVKKYIDDLLAKNPLAEVGLKNSIDSYGKRSLERDKGLRMVNRYLIEKVRELEIRVDRLAMKPEELRAEKEFEDF